MTGRIVRNISVLMVVVLVSVVAPTTNADPYPLEYWALREVINRAQVSPDGKHLGLMKIPSRDANPIIEVYDASDLAKEPFRLNADPMEITNFYWASDTVIIFSLRQKVRNMIDGFNQGVYERKVATLDIEAEKLRQFAEINPGIENLLPNKPDKVILSFSEGGEDGPASKLKKAFRPRAYWQLDLKTGNKQLLIRGKISLGNIDFDADGRPLFARGFDLAKGDFIWYYREPGKSGWEEIYRQSEDSFEIFELVDLDSEAPGHVLVLANNGHDKIGLWSFDLNKQSFDELIYRRSDADVFGTRHHSNDWTYPDRVTGVTYFTDKLHTLFFDEVEGATYSQLEEIIPFAHYLSINSRSRDGNTMTIYNAGPRDPGTYYLLKDGALEAVGSKQPLLKSEELADVKYITYKSRDGLDIHAYLTVPNSKPPYPLIVLPHGGPFVQETVIYDEWAQMLANNGYLVVQPQYRGSMGYGLEFNFISFRNGGQGGYKMQDDKDDAALYLVKQGLAEADRMAMFGWSYGGYAALVAASRTPQIYQCVIAGAAVADMLQQINYYRYQLRGAGKEQQLSYRQGSINPIEEVEKVNVPMLLIHGNVDQRVPIEHANRYRKLLDKYNKDYKYVELDGADHFSSTLFFDHQQLLYTSIIDFLHKDCGPGGL